MYHRRKYSGVNIIKHYFLRVPQWLSAMAASSWARSLIKEEELYMVLAQNYTSVFKL